MGRDRDPHTVVLVAVGQSVPRSEGPDRETVALGAERRRRSELREENRRVVGRDGVSESCIRVSGVEVQAREVVAEGAVVDAPLLEDVAREPVERGVVVADQHVGPVEEWTGFGEMVRTELVVFVERLAVTVLAGERTRKAGHVRR
jgi:hypothetical protein